MISLQPLFYDFISNEYVSKNIKETGLCAFKFTQEDESSIWTIRHELGFNLFKINVFSNFELIIPNEIIINSNDAITILFSTPISGVANVLYYSNNPIECIPQNIIDESILCGLNSSSLNSSDINGLEPLLS